MNILTWMQHNIFSRIDILLSAFFGAFFAFQFNKLFQYYLDKKNIYTNHLKSLKYMQIYFNDQIENIRLNIETIDSYIMRLEDYKTNLIKTVFPLNQLIDLEANYTYFYDLRNNEFVNELYSYLRKTEVCNYKISVIRDYIKLLNANLIEDKLLCEKYKELMLGLKIDFDDIKGFLDEFQKDSVILISKLRVRIKKDTKKKVFNKYSVSKNYEKDFQKLVEEELVKIRIEIDLNR